MITRFRGDTYPLDITLKKNGTPVDLDDVTSVEFAFNKLGTVVVKAGTKDASPLTGKVTFTFTDADVDTVGIYNYDVQVVWVDTTKTTFIRSQLNLLADVNTN